jgi:hypothetical protein
MPVVFLPEARVFFAWQQGTSEAPGLLAGRARGVTLAELVVPPGKRAVVVGGAVPLLDALTPLAALDEAGRAALGPSEAAWATAARFAVEQVQREQIVPAMSPQDDGFEARWTVALASGPERRFVRALAAAMPPSAHAVPLGVADDEVWPAERLLRRFLDEAADALVRAGVVRKQQARQKRARGKAPAKTAQVGSVSQGEGKKAQPGEGWGAHWSRKLLGPERKLEGGLVERRAAVAIEAWSEPVVRDAGRLRAAFRLELPASDDGPFLLRFLLQDPDDPSFLLSADEVWATDAREVQRLGRLLHDPQGTLLRALYQAAQSLPALAVALGQPAPTHLELDAGQAWAFLGDGARTLSAAGFSVLVPGELTGIGRRVRLQMDFDFFDRMADGLLPDAEPTLDEWLSFEWRVALGDETLSEEEFAELVRHKTPLVKHRGIWVVVDPFELPRIQARLKSRGGKARSRDALVATLAGETQSDGMRVKARALGAFARLLDRLRGGEREVEAPEALRATLRPYQRHGLG